MKEPLIVDFLEQFLAEHHLSQNPSIPSRPSSVSSHRSSSTQPHHRLSLTGTPNTSPIHSSSRLSVRVSQAELLEYGQHSQSPTSLSSPGSPTTSLGSRNNNGSPRIAPRSPHRLSRPTSMTSLDAAISTMDLSHQDETCHPNNKSILGRPNGSPSAIKAGGKPTNDVLPLAGPTPS